MMVKKEDNSNPYIHRQTLANNARFTTPELSELERDIASASEKSLALEQHFFADFVSQTAALSDVLGKLARGAAEPVDEEDLR